MSSEIRRRPTPSSLSSRRRRTVRATSPAAVTKTLSAYIAAPAHRPIAATSHKPAAVVNPCTEIPVRRIAPAPRNPMPETTDAAIREGSTVTRSPFP